MRFWYLATTVGAYVQGFVGQKNIRKDMAGEL